MLLMVPPDPQQELAQLVDRLEAFVRVQSPGRPVGAAWDRAVAAYELVRELNATLPPDQQWAINQTLLSAKLGVKRSVAQQFLADRSADVAEVNRSLPLPPHRQNFGHDFEVLRLELEKRLVLKKQTQQQSAIDPELTNQFLALLKRSQADPQIFDLSAGNLLRQIRRAKGLTQSGLAKVLDIPSNSVVAIENSQRRPSPTILLQYAKWLGF